MISSNRIIRWTYSVIYRTCGDGSQLAIHNMNILLILPGFFV